MPFLVETIYSATNIVIATWMIVGPKSSLLTILTRYLQPCSPLFNAFTDWSIHYRLLVYSIRISLATLLHWASLSREHVETRKLMHRPTMLTISDLRSSFIEISDTCDIEIIFACTTLVSNKPIFRSYLLNRALRRWASDEIASSPC